MTPFLSTLRDLDAGATPGPWFVIDHERANSPRISLATVETIAEIDAALELDESQDPTICGFWHDEAHGITPSDLRSNAALICAMRSALPDLLAVCEAAQSIVDRLSGMFLSTETARVVSELRTALSRLGAS